MAPATILTQQQYAHVPSSEEESFETGSAEKGIGNPPSNSSLSRFTKLAALIGAAFVSLVAVFALGFASGYHSSGNVVNEASTLAASSNCTEPLIRKEWRTLSKKEKKGYLDAFQCFIDSPSKLGMNGSLYDDYSWAHNLIAHSTHGKAPFLTWHRRFIYVYEKQLRETCGYEGAVPFWDWSLDWEDLPNSLIFDPKLGFGGDGDSEAPKFGNAHCVTSMPFKGLKPQWAGTKYDPHCLTRSFNDDDWIGHFLSPTSLAEVMAKDNYKDFFLALEMRAHDIIPTGVRGDFTAFTAPNDPIFYLHHAQLDRIWWLWQMRDKKNRVSDYGGVGNGQKEVTLTDVLPLAGLDDDVMVADIMDTEAAELCYRYGYV